MANEEANHHEASAWDLKAQVFNFVIFLAILSKVIKPLREKFNSQAADVKAQMESAARNIKDADDKLAQFEDKIKNLDSDLIKIVADYELEEAQFAKNKKEETQTLIARMKVDLENKLEGEKEELIDELNHDLINKVVSSTKATIKSNTSYQAKATQNIVSELR